jgi:hypothetical protein
MNRKIAKDILRAAKREAAGRWGNYKGGAKLALVDHMRILASPMGHGLMRDHKEEKAERKARWRRAMRGKPA